MRGMWVAVSLCLVAFAGCTEEPLDEVSDEPASFENLEATADTGVIRGVVLDETITPIAGATVKLQGLDAETTTDADGAFGFQGLPEGVYFLDVDAIGYGAAQSQADVVAGVNRPDVIKVLLVKDESELPFVEQFVFTGFIQCSGSTPAYRVAVCGAVNAVAEIAGQEPPLDDVFLAGFAIGLDPDFIQAEMVWESTQALGDRMQLTVEVDPTDGNDIGTGSGVSPVTVSANKEAIVAAGMDVSGYMQQRVFNMEHPATTPPVPVCGVPNPVHGGDMCVKGIGLTFDQRFEVFTHNFYRFTPAEGWTFVNDGAPTP